jgi:WD40 repeat protein
MTGAERARLAEDKRDITEKARKDAEAARDRLAGEKANTDKARQEAENARDALRLTQEDLARIEYGRTVQVAYQAWRDNDVVATLALLDGTRKDLRGWEWHFVYRLCHTHKISFRGEGASWSRDGSKVLTGVENAEKIWDGRTGKEVLALKEPIAWGEPWIPMASLSPDGAHVLTIGQDGKAKVWDASSGAKVLTLEAHPGRISCGSWSADGSRIVTGTEMQAPPMKEAWAKVWNAKTGTELQILKGHTVRVGEASFSPDGSRIVTTGPLEKANGGDGALLWDATTGKVIVTRTGGRFAAFSPDSSRVVFTGTRHLSPIDNRYRQEVQVLNANTGAEVCALKGQTVFFASFSPDTAKLVTCSDVANTATVWDAKTGTEILTLRGHHGAVMSASFSPDGTRIVTASFDRTARVWDARTGAELRVIKGHTGEVWSASFTPNGKHVVTGGVERNAAQTPNAWSAIKVWDVDSSAEVPALPGPYPRAFGCFPNVSFSPDNSRIAIAGGRNKTAKAWDVLTGAELFSHGTKAPGPREEVWSVVWSPDGSSLLTCEEREARVWDVKTGAKVLTLAGKGGLFRCAAWSPDGSRIVTGENQSFLPIHAHVWDAKTGAKLFGLPAKAWVRALAFSPDSALIAVGTDTKTAYIFDAKTGAEIRVLRGHANTVTAVSFNHDGTQLVTGSEDQTAKIWDVKSGGEIVTLKGHTDQVQAAAFSPDGSRIVTGSFDRTVKIWDAKGGAELLSIFGHSDHVLSASWSPDGLRIATGSRDQTAKIWDARPLTRPGE